MQPVNLILRKLKYIFKVLQFYFPPVHSNSLIFLSQIYKAKVIASVI